MCVLNKFGESTLCHIAYTSLLVSSREDYYFENGCSRHITREKNYLKDIKFYFKRYVTLGDGVKGNIIGKGKLGCHGLPCLNDVLLFEGVTH